MKDMKNLFAVVLFAMIFAVSCDNDAGFIGTSDEGAISGKYKTMLVVDQFMYAVNDSELISFDISDGENPQQIDKQNVGMDIENLYHSEGTLFIGSRSQLHIYSIAANGIPEQKSSTDYLNFDAMEVTPCDPVVAQKDIAYVTLSSSVWNADDPCGGMIDVNELRAYDVSDLTNPVLKETFNMHSPKGLSIDGDYLFVSNTEQGFSVFEVDHQGEVWLKENITGFTSYDLIAKDGKLLVVSPDEIRQYDYTDINDIRLYSTLSLR